MMRTLPLRKRNCTNIIGIKIEKNPYLFLAYTRDAILGIKCRSD